MTITRRFFFSLHSRKTHLKSVILNMSESWLLKKGYINECCLNCLRKISRKPNNNWFKFGKHHKEYYQIAGHSTGKNGKHKRLIVTDEFVYKLVDNSDSREMEKSQNEINFYERMSNESTAIPTYYGTCRLEGAVYIKLENIYRNMYRNEGLELCFCDVKIGPARTPLVRLTPKSFQNNYPKFYNFMNSAYIRTFVPVLADTGMQILGLKVWENGRMMRYGHRAGYGGLWLGNDYIISEFFKSIKHEADFQQAVYEIRGDLVRIQAFITENKHCTFFGCSIILAYKKSRRPNNQSNNISTTDKQSDQLCCDSALKTSTVSSSIAESTRNTCQTDSGIMQSNSFSCKNNDTLGTSRTFGTTEDSTRSNSTHSNRSGDTSTFSMNEGGRYGVAKLIDFNNVVSCERVVNGCEQSNIGILNLLNSLDKL